MYYVPSHNAFTVKQEDLQRAADLFKYAIKKVRLENNLPIIPYKREGMLSNADLAMHAILEGAKALGIDFGVTWGNELDVFDV